MTYQKYQLLAEGTNVKLTKDINKLLKTGWELYGPVMIQDGLFFQALIKNNNKGSKVDDKE